MPQVLLMPELFTPKWYAERRAAGELGAYRKGRVGEAWLAAWDAEWRAWENLKRGTEAQRGALGAMMTMIDRQREQLERAAELLHDLLDDALDHKSDNWCGHCVARALLSELESEKEAK